MAGAIGNSIESIREAAYCVRVIEENNGDLSYVPPGMLDMLRRVAYGQVLPEIAVRFIGQPARLRELSRLVPPDQKQIAQSGSVDLVVRRNDGFDTRKARPEELTTDQFRQVFDRGRIRPVSEQTVILESEARQTTERVKPVVGVCPECGQPLPKRRRRL